MAPAPSDSEVALHAALDGNLHLLKKMVKKVDLQGVKDGEGPNVIHFAMTKGHLDVCRFLVEELGFHINSTSAEAVRAEVLG